MVRSSLRAPALLLLLSSIAPADVTLRQTSTVKLPPFIPPEFQAQMREQLQRGMPAETLLRIRGDKTYASYGPLAAIADYGRNEVTLLDPKGKRYASVPLAEFGDRLAAALKASVSRGAGQPLAQTPRFDVAAKKTGQVAPIQGIQAEESLTEITMQMPPMTQIPAGPLDAGLSTLRLEIRSWVAQAGDIRRVPALKELAEYTERSMRVLDPSEFLNKALATVPGFGEQLGEVVGKLAKNNSGLSLKVSTAIYMPAIAQLLQLAAGGAPPGFDPDGPMAESLTQVAEISTDAVPDSAFLVPAGYHTAPFEELVKAAIQTPVALPAVVKQDR
jgi:hypothetical protein